MVPMAGQSNARASRWLVVDGYYPAKRGGLALAVVRPLSFKRQV